MKPPSLLEWFAGGSRPYMRLDCCMARDWPWIALFVAANAANLAGYAAIGIDWWRKQRAAPPSPARNAFGEMKWIFAFCGVCGYLTKIVALWWPAWRLFALLTCVLDCFTLRYAARTLRGGGVSLILDDLAAGARDHADLEDMREFVNSIPCLAWSARADGYIDFYNDRWYAYTGTTAAEMRGWGWRQCHDPAVLPTVESRWAECVRRGGKFEMDFPLRDAGGRYRWFKTRVVPRLKDGRVVRWYGTNCDIDHDRRNAAQSRDAMRELAERLERSAGPRPAREGGAL